MRLVSFLGKSVWGRAVSAGGNVGGDCGDKVIREPKMDGQALRRV